MKIANIVLSGAALALVMSLTSAAGAEDCPRG